MVAAFFKQDTVKFAFMQSRVNKHIFHSRHQTVPCYLKQLKQPYLGLFLDYVLGKRLNEYYILVKRRSPWLTVV